VSKQAAAAGEAAAVPQPDAHRASAPEAAHGPPAQPVIVTFEASESRPKAAPANEAGAATTPAVRQDVGALVAQGREFFEAGDLVAARILFMRAANAGDAAAAIAMGATYDPVVLAERGVRGVASDLDKARAWYERAKDMGSSEGPRRLEMLANR
jgi:TPR repeat protein